LTEESAQPKHNTDPIPEGFRRKMMAILDSERFVGSGKSRVTGDTKQGTAQVSETELDNGGLHKSWSNATTGIRLDVWARPANATTLEELRNDTSLVELPSPRVGDHIFAKPGDGPEDNSMVSYTQGTPGGDNPHDPGPAVITTRLAGSQSPPFPDPNRFADDPVQQARAGLHLMTLQSFTEVRNNFGLHGGKY
jgi:hypothetical protein